MRREDGFGLVEAMMALGVMLATALIMAYTAAAAFGPTAVARQRQAATGLADEAIEEIRALPFDTIKKGLDNADLSATTDPNIVKNCAGVTGDYCYGGEKIPHGTNSNIVPLVPHQRTTTVRNIPYTLSTYVTYYQNDNTTNTFRITAVVTWAVAETHKTGQMIVQTIANSPAGCLSTATHPFSAPCQPYLYSSAIQDLGSVGITGTISNISLDHASLWTTSHSTNMSIEQISSALSTIQASGVELQLQSAAVQTVGRDTTSAGAENDPSQPTNDYQTASSPNQTSGTLSASGGNNILAVTSHGGDSGSTTSTTASSYPAHPCADPAGVNQTDLLPCANSTLREGSNSSQDMTAALTLQQGNDYLGPADLVRVAAAPSAGVTFVNRDVPSGDGLVHAEATRSLGTVKLGGLPSGAAPPVGWNGYFVRLTNFADSARAEAGVAAAAPSVSASGTISYWNGTGYSQMTIAPGAAVSIPVTALHLSYTEGQTGPVIAVDIVASLSTGGTTTADTVGCSTTCRTNASAQSASPLKGDITYTVTRAGATLANLTLGVDFGGVRVKANYTAAPSA